MRVADGKPVWQQQVNALVEGGVGVGEDCLVVGLGQRGIGAGRGWLAALDLASGEEHWRHQVGGNVRCAPMAEGMRVYASACDGAMYCLELESGKPLWRSPVYQGNAQMPASPLVIKEGNFVQSVIAATYGGMQGRHQGVVAALDERGRRLWEKAAGGNVRGTPAASGGALFVTSFNNSPSAGEVMAYDLRTGRERWEKPFRIQGDPRARGAYNFSASPLVRDGVVYVTSLNRRVYALQADSGRLVWEAEVPAWPAVSRSAPSCTARHDRRPRGSCWRQSLCRGSWQTPPHAAGADHDRGPTPRQPGLPLPCGPARPGKERQNGAIRLT